MNERGEFESMRLRRAAHKLLEARDSTHVGEDDLVQYVMGRLDGDAETIIEAHAFWCASCLGKLKEAQIVADRLAQMAENAIDLDKSARLHRVSSLWEDVIDVLDPVGQWLVPAVAEGRGKHESGEDLRSAIVQGKIQFGERQEIETALEAGGVVVYEHLHGMFLIAVLDTEGSKALDALQREHSQEFTYAELPVRELDSYKEILVVVKKK